MTEMDKPPVMRIGSNSLTFDPPGVHLVTRFNVIQHSNCSNYGLKLQHWYLDIIVSMTHQYPENAVAIFTILLKKSVQQYDQDNFYVHIYI